MGYSLEQFADGCHRILTEDPGPEGRKKVCALVQDVLAGRGLRRHASRRRRAGAQDPVRRPASSASASSPTSTTGAKESQPHDHGPSWAIYGQARGETVMSDWAVVEPASEDKPGKVRHVRAYPLKPGMAKVYNEGDVHSPQARGLDAAHPHRGHQHGQGEAPVVREGVVRTAPHPHPRPKGERGLVHPSPPEGERVRVRGRICGGARLGGSCRRGSGYSMWRAVARADGLAEVADHDAQRHVDAGRDAGRGDDVAVLDDVQLRPRP